MDLVQLHRQSQQISLSGPLASGGWAATEDQMSATPNADDHMVAAAAEMETTMAPQTVATIGVAFAMAASTKHV